MIVTPEWVSAIASAASALFSALTAVGVYFAYKQLRTSREIAQLQFEDGLDKEYRKLATELPTAALLAEELRDDEYKKSFDKFFHYVDLSNEQVRLRQRGRIGPEVWLSWCEGIKTNLSLPSFRKAWTDIKERSNSFQELRRLEVQEFKRDPIAWNEI